MKIPIRHIRDVAVILDADLAAIYGVPTKRLNEQVKRNKDRFPADFVFVLTAEEWRSLRLNESEAIGNQVDKGDRSQIATGSTSAKHRDKRARPYAFTEHGALMAANVLRSAAAVKMSVFIVRAFVRQRELLAGNEAILSALPKSTKRSSSTTAACAIFTRSFCRSCSRRPRRSVNWVSMFANGLQPTA